MTRAVARARKAAKRKQEKKVRVVMTVRETADALGMGLNQAYEAIKAGTIPSIRFNKKIYVPRVAFERMLAGNA